MRKYKNTIIIVSVVVLSLGLLSFVVLKNKKPREVFLLGGLDNRSGDKNIQEQSALLSQGLGNSKSVTAFRYTDSSGIIKQIEFSKSPVYVVLFSAGCRHSEKVAQAMLNKGYSLNNMYIVEPYAVSSSGATTKSVIRAVNLGVPQKNVVVGKSKSTGKGVVPNTTPTPECSPSHWCAITMVGQMIANGR